MTFDDNFEYMEGCNNAQYLKRGRYDKARKKIIEEPFIK